jgi:hypothetical protein
MNLLKLRYLWTLPGRKQCTRSSSFSSTITIPNLKPISSTVEEFWKRYHQNRWSTKSKTCLLSRQKIPSFSTSQTKANEASQLQKWWKIGKFHLNSKQNPQKFQYTALSGIPRSSVSMSQNLYIVTMKATLITCILKKSRQNRTCLSRAIEFWLKKVKISQCAAEYRASNLQNCWISVVWGYLSSRLGLDSHVWSH